MKNSFLKLAFSFINKYNKLEESLLCRVSTTSVAEHAELPKEMYYSETATGIQSLAPVEPAKV